MHRARLIRCCILSFGVLIFVRIAVSTSADDPLPAGSDPSGRVAAHWAFQPLHRPIVPAVRDSSRVRTAVDGFVLARLESAGLAFADEADRTTLIRRASFDLLGLPPAPDEVEAFMNDAAPDAYERLLDRLLGSPHFGERWGRHWLDEVGYVDVLGTDNDATIISTGENKWHYRDYVIRSLNADKPLPRFLTEQIAGDELVDWCSVPRFTPEILELLVATGFLRNAADDTDAGELNRPDTRHSVLERTAEVLAGSLLGLTFQCAKCHDHKYEPITQHDYYAFKAVLQPALNPDRWLAPKQRQLPDVSPAEKTAIEQHNAELDRRVSELETQQAERRRPYAERLAETKIAAIPEPIRADTKAALDTPPEQRTEVQKYLAAKLEALVRVKPEEVSAVLSDPDRAAIAETDQQIAAIRKQKRAWQHLQALYDVGPPTPTRILRRGELDSPGDEVAPALPRVLCDPPAAAEIAGTDNAGKSSGRRLALARRLTDPTHRASALVLRVRVNRIWQHLFGHGIVESPDNLGLSGAPPSHPELLEWIAAEYADRELHLKPLLKLIMSSAVYRQASARLNDAAQTVDPENRLLWRQRLRRLESEAIRDSLLATSGRLNRELYGTPVPVEPRPDGMFVVQSQGVPAAAPLRRSNYLLARRNYHPTLLAVFDQPNLTTNCTLRTPSAVVLQSLAMLNDAFVIEQAGHVGERIAARIPADDLHGRVHAAFRMVLGRSPTAHESAWCVDGLMQWTEAVAVPAVDGGDVHPKSLSPHEHVTRVVFARGEGGAERARDGLAALTHLCHTLFNTSEFLQVP